MTHEEKAKYAKFHCQKCDFKALRKSNFITHPCVKNSQKILNNETQTSSLNNSNDHTGKDINVELKVEVAMDNKGEDENVPTHYETVEEHVEKTPSFEELLVADLQSKSNNMDIVTFNTNETMEEYETTQEIRSAPEQSTDELSQEDGKKLIENTIETIEEKHELIQEMSSTTVETFTKN